VRLTSAANGKWAALSITADGKNAHVRVRRVNQLGITEVKLWPDKFFPRAVRRAQEALREAGMEDEAARLDGVSWHGLRHTRASRLTMAGVAPRTLQTLGNWRSLSMVERYSHRAGAICVRRWRSW
jgi:integrase